MGIPQVAKELSDSVDVLAVQVVESVWEHLPGYDTQHMRRRDLEKFVVPNLTVALSAMEQGLPPSTTDRRWAVELGRSRALQGVLPEAMMQSWRRAERVVFEAFLATGGVAPEDLRICSQRLGLVFDSLVEASVASYRRTQDEITIHFEQVAADLVVRLAGGERIDREEVADQARLVGAEPNQSYQAVALGLPEGGTPPAIGHVQRHLLAAIGPVTEGRILAGSPAGKVVLLVPLARPTSDLLPILERAMRRPELWEDALAGIGEPVSSLAEVTPSCSQALSALEVGRLLGRTRQVLSYADVLPEVLLAHNQDVAALLVEFRLGPLLQQPHLIKTLRSYISSGLSVSRTARELVVHPNTVTYRLERVRKLTGRRREDSLHEADMILALRALDVLGHRDKD